MCILAYSRLCSQVSNVFDKNTNYVPGGGAHGGVKQVFHDSYLLISPHSPNTTDPQNQTINMDHDDPTRSKLSTHLCLPHQSYFSSSHLQVFHKKLARHCVTVDALWCRFFYPCPVNVSCFDVQKS